MFSDWMHDSTHGKQAKLHKHFEADMCKSTE